MTGEDPSEIIDHKDGDTLNLKWPNLRPATNGTNIQNSKLRSDNKSGVKGVCWDTYHKKWVAHVTVDGKQVKIGRFKTIEEATVAVEAARERMHGEFARFK